RTPVVDEPGTFAVRGGVIDVYAPLAPHPVRIELFGDEIDSLRWFDAESQRTLRTVEWIHLHPVRETVNTGAGDVRSRMRVEVDDLRVLRTELDHARTFGDIEHAQPLVAAIERWRGDGLRVAIACDSQSRSDRLFGVLAARGVEVRLAAPGERPGAVDGVALIAGAPAHGFASRRDRVAVVTAADVFGQRTHHAQRQRKRARDALLGGVGDFSMLSPGDYLVHQRHGVGRYQGLEKIEVGAPSREGVNLAALPRDSPVGGKIGP